MDFNKLSLTLNNLASTNRAINEIVNYNISNNAILNKNRFIIWFRFRYDKTKKTLILLLDF